MQNLWVEYYQGYPLSVFCGDDDSKKVALIYIEEGGHYKFEPLNNISSVYYTNTIDDGLDYIRECIKVSHNE
jgi:hypothetical protein